MSTKYKDIKGVVFGYWTAMEYLGKSRWLCVCICGKSTTERTLTQLNKLSYQDCGCLNTKTFHIGAIFGSLTILAKETRGKNRAGFSLCLCTCGNQEWYSNGGLKKGKIKCNECVSKESKRYKDLTGQRFGRLLVTKCLGPSTTTGKRGVYWECLCDCGSYHTVYSQSLVSGDSKSCGCLNQESRCKPKPHLRGINAPNYKGNSDINSQIRDSLEYKNWRASIFIRDSRSCQLCTNYAKSKDNPLNAHHIRTLANLIEDYSIQTLDEARDCAALWDINNGMTLCKSCHNLVHSLSLITIC